MSGEPRAITEIFFTDSVQILGHAARGMTWQHNVAPKLQSSFSSSLAKIEYRCIFKHGNRSTERLGPSTDTQ
jgi:hypothetical protein